MQKPTITATSLIGMIDTMIISLKFSISMKDHSIFKSIANPILDMLDIHCNDNIKYDMPEELFTTCRFNMNEAYAIADADAIAEDYDFPEQEFPSNLPRALQPGYEYLAQFAIETMQSVKATLEAYLLKVYTIKVAKMIMAKRMATYEESKIGTIADLPNTIIDKIADMASQ